MKISKNEKEILIQLVVNEMRDDNRIAPENTLKILYTKLKKVM